MGPPWLSLALGCCLCSLLTVVDESGLFEPCILLVHGGRRGLWEHIGRKQPSAHSTDRPDGAGSANFLPYMRARAVLSQVGLFPPKDRQMCGNCPSRAQQGPGSPVHVVEPQTLSGWEPCLLVVQNRGHLGKATEEGSMVRLSGLVSGVVSFTGSSGLGMWKGPLLVLSGEGGSPASVCPVQQLPFLGFQGAGSRAGWVLMGRALAWHA